MAETVCFRWVVLKTLPCEQSDKKDLIKGPVIIYGGGWHRREMVFVAKSLLAQPLKRKKIDYPTSNIN
jgi:hypothetical protein